MYFPDLAFDADRELNDFIVKWYATSLKAMREPSLWNLSRSDSTASVYRLLWLPTFDHPICVRVDRSAGDIRLHAVKLDGLGGYHPGKVALRREAELDKEHWDSLQAHLGNAGFWGMRTRGGKQGLDGKQLIVEGVEDGKYHVVDRWSPDAGDYRDLCGFLLEVAGLPVE